MPKFRIVIEKQTLDLRAKVFVAESMEHAMDLARAQSMEHAMDLARAQDERWQDHSCGWEPFDSSECWDIREDQCEEIERD